MNTNMFKILILIILVFIINCKEENIDGKSCVNNEGNPQLCYPPFENYASAGGKVIATNTCGLTRRQKYCLGLSIAEMRSRCAYCDNSNISERHSPDYLTDQNPNNWWQSETLADTKDIAKQKSINLTLNLGNKFHIAFIHLQFKSSRPNVMILYRKYDNNSPWEPWQYFASNCMKFFNMSYVKGQIIEEFDKVLCIEDFSSLNEFYNGIVMFATIHGRPGTENFFSNKKMMDWVTASQIRIELRKMHTFGEQNDDEELLLTYFYAIKNLQVSGRCWCNGHGNECRKSTGEGIEPQLSCVCHPSHHTTGQSCEKCENFYQDRPWQSATISDANICQKCNCNENSESCVFDEELYIKSGNISGGLCLNCRWNTRGPHCEKCLEGFYKNPYKRNQCIPCNCNAIGRATVQCDNNGICLCETGIEGEKCDRCKKDHFNFGSKGCQPCNCHLPGVNLSNRKICNSLSGNCYCKKNVVGDKCDKCALGYFSLTAEDPLGCRPCFCFAHTKKCTMAKEYLLTQIESEFHGSVDDWKYGIANLAPEYSPMLDMSTISPSITWFKGREPWKDDYFLYAPKKFLGNRRLSYNLNLILVLSFGARPDYKLFTTKLISMINDIQLISGTLSVSVPFDIGENPLPDAGNTAASYSFRLNEESGFWRDRVDFYKFHSILNNLEAIKIRLTNHYGYIKLHKAVLQTAIHSSQARVLNLTLPEIKSVEQCSCPPQYSGLSCENCASGFYREYSLGIEFAKCVKCSCNNQADTCNMQTGECHCLFNTFGKECDKCISGFYGDPKSQIRNICKPCNCPGGSSCEEVPTSTGTQVVCTDCPENLGGYRCERCKAHYFGNPKLNISCQPCECHENIDYLSHCDFFTGKCPNCLYNSAGNYCETCKVGYYLLPDERAPKRCERCICNPFGSENGGTTCDVNTSQCFCKPLLIGQKCDICRPGYFNLTVLNPCQSCDCHLPGTIDHTCDQNTGQCKCKPGVSGLKCDHCQNGYFNLSNDGCQKCSCNPEGSTNFQCDLKTGQCSCKPNIMSMKCDKCLENYHNLSTNGCQICPPCYSLIQTRLYSLKYEISRSVSSNDTIHFKDEKSWNESTVIKMIQHFNETVLKTSELIVGKIKGIKELESHLRKTNVTLDNLKVDILDLKTNGMNERIKGLYEDIENTENSIKSLLKSNFSSEINTLKTYIRNKKTSNENMTRIARIVREYQFKVSQQNENLNNILMQSEMQLNNSLNSFVDLLGEYYNYINQTKIFNEKELKEFSDKVKLESSDNLLRISNVNATLANIENQIRDGKNKLKILSNETNEIIFSFVDAENQINQFDPLFRSFAINLPDLKALEDDINNRTKFLIKKTQTFSEALNMLKKLNEAQNNLTIAFHKANKTLLKLEDLYKDFNEIVNKNKLEAEIQLKRLPSLKIRIENIEQEIKTLNESFRDLITKIVNIHQDVKNIHHESVNMGDKLNTITDQITRLLNKSEEDLKLSKNLGQEIDKIQRENLVMEENLFLFSKSLEAVEKLNQNQNETGAYLESNLDMMMREILEMTNKSDTANDLLYNEYSKRINKISDKIDSFFKFEYQLVFRNMEEFDEKSTILEKEIEMADKVINRLELIDKHMVNVNENVCYKSGGKTEGL